MDTSTAQILVFGVLALVIFGFAGYMADREAPSKKDQSKPKEPPTLL